MNIGVAEELLGAAGGFILPDDICQPAALPAEQLGCCGRLGSTAPKYRNLPGLGQTGRSEKCKLPGGADPGCRIVRRMPDPESPGEQVGSSGIDADSVTVIATGLCGATG